MATQPTTIILPDECKFMITPQLNEKYLFNVGRIVHTRWGTIDHDIIRSVAEDAYRKVTGRTSRQCQFAMLLKCTNPINPMQFHVLELQQYDSSAPVLQLVVPPSRIQKITEFFPLK